MNVNPVNWFEIPVTDLKRAMDFYAKVFPNTELEVYEQSKMDMEMAIFKSDREVYGATGALVKGENMIPTTEGTTVYFFCEDVNNQLAIIEELGATVIFPKMEIGENGFIAQFIDSEGNRIALHSMQ